MKFRSEKIITLVLLAVMVGIGLWGRVNLPDAPVAVHFGLDGTPNGYQPRDMAMFLMPALAIVTLGLCLWVVPALMPKSAPLERSATAYGAVILAVAVMLTAIHGAIVLHAMGVPLDMARIGLGATGAVFVIIGNYLPKTRQNWAMGIRTPWTLSDERVWDKTHRFSGPVFMLGGLAILAIAALMPGQDYIAVLIAAIIAPVILSLVYSYIVAKKLGVV